MESGTRLGPYEVLEQLGAGGMGEVYLARDARLGREVAIKVLPAEFAGDPERRARFEQEARAAAALNHPNIAVVHDFGEEAGTHFIVQEHLQGQTLRSALTAGALSLKRALALGCEVAEALAAAHAGGIVHRDLKPDNIFISPEGHAKILDFGLAKLVETGPASGDASMSPTVVGTMTGTIMGTAGYMAPEQIEGGPVDHRADLFAFGCVLYEVVTGRRAFAGQSVPDTLSRILHAEPDPVGVANQVPDDLQRILTKCLRKDVAERYQHADDLVVDLRVVDPSSAVVKHDSLGSMPAAGQDSRAPNRWVWVGTLVVAALLGAVGGSRFVAPTLDESVAEPVRARVGLEPVEMFASGRPITPAFALSPDGRSVVFAGRTESDGDSGSMLFRRDFTEMVGTPVRGTDGASWPFFAPDGERIGYVAGVRDRSSLRSVPIEGGLPTTHVEELWPFGVSWGHDGYIYYTPDYRSGIWRVSADGGDPEVVVDLEPGDYSYRHARPVPGTDLLLYVAMDRPNMCRWESARIMARAISGGEAWVVHEGGAYPRVLPTGHLLFNEGTSLMAVPFDRSAGAAMGRAVPVLDGVMASQCGPVPFVEFGMAMADVAADGKLLYLPGGLLPAQRLQVVTDSREGAPTVLSEANVALSPRVAPDGRRVLVGSPDGLLLVDPDRAQAGLRITSGYFATFSPDSEWVAFMDRNQIGRHASDGTGEREVLLDVTSETYVGDWASDGTMLLVRSEGDISRTNWGIWAFTPGAGPDSLRRLLGDDGSQTFPVLSPDERWLAYTDETSEPRVFITSYPALQGRYLVGAGYAPAWSADGATLYFQADGNAFTGGARRLLAADVSDPRSPGIAAEYMSLTRYAWSSPVRGYDVFPDGRVVYSQVPQASVDGAADDAPRQMELVMNWFTELERLVPVRR